jgi:16S rRNA (uracil1498-N3)-methyltransferase
MRTYTPRHRLFVDAPLAAGAVVPAAAEQAHYLVNVLRLGAGAAVALFNGRDGEWSASVEPQGKRGAVLHIGERLRVQADAPDLWLLFAPVKGQRTEFIAEKATELGVSVLQPVITRRTIASRVNVERLAANAREAAEQCWRLDVPEVRPPLTLDTLMAAWPAERRIMFCDETGEAPPAIGALKGAPRGPWAVLVGPEGGFAAEELDLVRRIPLALPVGLGPRILRADTACTVALALLQAALGDLA